MVTIHTVSEAKGYCGEGWGALNRRYHNEALDGGRDCILAFIPFPLRSHSNSSFVLTDW